MRIQLIKSYIHIFNIHRTTPARLISKTCASRTSQNTLENTWRWSTLSRAPCGRKRSRPDPSRAPASPHLSSPPLRRLPWLCSGARAAVRCCARIPRKVLCDLAAPNPSAEEVLPGRFDAPPCKVLLHVRFHGRWNGRGSLPRKSLPLCFDRCQEEAPPDRAHPYICIY